MRWVLAAETVSGGALGPLEDRMIGLIESTASSPLALIGGMVLAFGFGVVHAIGPGHGKTVTSAYIAGTRTARRDAVALGGAVALMHTFSALVLGFVFFAVASSGGFVQQAGAWLRVTSGLLVLGVGVWLLSRRLRSRAPATAGSAHTHADGTTHSHDVDLDQVMTVRGLLLIGVSGGLLPSPSALLVLTIGLINNRTVYAIALVAVFGVGMAVTLSLLALATQEVKTRAARGWGGRRAERLVAALPVGGAGVLVIAGVVVTTTAVMGLMDVR